MAIFPYGSPVLLPNRFFMPQFSQLVPAVRRVAILGIAVLFLCGTSALAQEKQAPDVEVSVGIGNVAKLGHWLPVTFKNLDGSLSEATQFRVTVLDGDDTPSTISGPLATTESGLQGLVQFGRTYGDATFELLGKDDSVLATVATTVREDNNELMELVPSTGRLYVCMEPPVVDQESKNQLLVANLDLAFPGGKKNEDRVASVTTLNELPSTGIAWESCESAILLANREDWVAGLSNEAIDAIEAWVINGGHIVIAASPKLANLFQGDSPLARFAPGEIVGPGELDSSRRLEEFCDSKQPFLGRRGTMQVLKVENVDGRVSLGQDDLPLVIRKPMGLGEVTFITFDLTNEQFREWKAASRFMQGLMRLRFGDENFQQSTDSRTGTAVRHSGYKDFVGQMKVPLERFTTLRFIPFVLIALLIALYILCIGLGDWFLVGRIFRKHELTWITFPLLAALFCGIAWYATKISRPSQLQLNQVELVDVDSISGHVRATNWVNVYSPNGRTVDLSIGVSKAANDCSMSLESSRLSWLGLPGDGLGGMLNRANPGLYRTGYVNEVTPDSSQTSVVNIEMSGVELQVSSTRPLLGQWNGKFSERVESRLRVTDRLEGTLTNPFDVSLKDCRLYYDDLVYVVEGTFSADDDIDIRSDTVEKTIRSFLTRRRRSSDDSNKSQSVAWDTRDVNLGRIMQMMMFYHGSGGERYTGLTHAYHDFIEMTPQCSMDRAVLVGRLTDRISTIKLDGKDADELYDSSLTYVRVLLPVERRNNPRRR